MASVRTLWQQTFATGYYASAQPLGSQFRPSELAGYFNDLRPRAAWPGARDASGLPAPAPDDPGSGAPVTAMLQFGLGHWDLWLEAGRPDDHPSLRAVLAVADRVTGLQDARGRWVALPRGAPSYPGCGLYSALTQGEGVSLLARAWSARGSEAHRDAMRRAADALVLPVEAGGVARSTPEGLVLEEVVLPARTAILNGWIFALYGLHDLRLADPGHPASARVEEAVGSLARALPGFDRGYWSNYDLAGAIAKPNYHLLHIAQLRALERTFPRHAAAFAAMRARFEAYARRPDRRVRAVATKAWQVARRRRAKP